jgi:succinate dehydrogenase/fumarate reductase flavoprotein subunit
MKKLIGEAERLGVRARCDTRAVALIVDEHGSVAGVRTRHFGETGDVRARHGVVLAAGGYIMNDAMFARELAWMPRDLIKHGTNNDDGSGILLGVSAGGEPKGLDRAFLTSPFYPPADMLKGIVVNAEGRRFVARIRTTVARRDSWSSSRAASLTSFSIPRPSVTRRTSSSSRR